MPILEVELIVDRGEELPTGLAPAIAAAAAHVFNSSPGRTWVRLRSLPAAHYAENGGGPESGVRPVFVAVLHARRPIGEALEAEVRDLTAAVAEACGRPAENVHLFYQPDGAGRVAFGGALVS